MKVNAKASGCIRLHRWRPKLVLWQVSLPGKYSTHRSTLAFMNMEFVGTLINYRPTAYWKQMAAVPALPTSISKLVRRTGPWLFTDAYQTINCNITAIGFMVNVGNSDNDGIPGYTVLTPGKIKYFLSWFLSCILLPTSSSFTVFLSLPFHSIIHPPLPSSLSFTLKRLQ